MGPILCNAEMQVESQFQFMLTFLTYACFITISPLGIRTIRFKFGSTPRTTSIIYRSAFVEYHSPVLHWEHALLPSSCFTGRTWIYEFKQSSFQTLHPKTVGIPTTLIVNFVIKFAFSRMTVNLTKVICAEFHSWKHVNWEINVRFSQTKIDRLC